MTQNEIKTASRNTLETFLQEQGYLQSQCEQAGFGLLIEWAKEEFTQTGERRPGAYGDQK